MAAPGRMVPRRHEDLHLGQREGQEAQILPQPAPGREGIGSDLGQPLVMEAASSRLTEQENEEPSIDQEDIFDHMVLFLAALTLGLFRRVLGVDGAPFGAVMGTRGDIGAAAGRRSQALAPPPAGRPRWPRRPPRRQGAAPESSESGWEHHRGRGAPRVTSAGGHASTDGLCLALWRVVQLGTPQGMWRRMGA
jgi:hypothetical protein